MFDATPVTVADALLFFLVGIVYPVYGFIYHLSNSAEKLSLDPNVRVKFFTESILINVVTATAVVWIWLWDARSFATLGMQHNTNWSTLLTWLVVGLFVTFSAIQYHRVRTNANARETMREYLATAGKKTLLLMPKTSNEHHLAMCAGVVAGIAEEIVYRGYLIWLFALFFPIWVAAPLSIAIFICLHFYQDKAGLFQVGLFAAISTVLYLLSDSLVPVIVLHICIDVLNLNTGRIAAGR
ncbi:MAG: CPBP family intramembrane glutamic endopeptidase [Pseudomonadota bacterium]